MSLRPWLIASALIVPLAGWVSRPAPMSARYKIGITTQQTIDLSALGQGERNQTTQTVGFVSVTTSDSAGGTVIVMQVDSVRLDSALHAPAAVLDSLKGATTRSFYGADGKVTRLGHSNASTALLSLGLDGLGRRFVPPTATHRKAGATWTDTVDVADTVSGGMVSTRTVANYATSDDAVDGAKATKIAASFSSAVQGSQSGDGGEGSFEGTGTGTSTWVYGSDAAAISGTIKSVQNLTFTSPNAPAPIPITVQNDVAVTRLK
ncbi:MAG: hypothetical protein ABI765_07725 [Gemmatimonadota bacterium]